MRGRCASSAVVAAAVEVTGCCAAPCCRVLWLDDNQLSGFLPDWSGGAVPRLLCVPRSCLICSQPAIVAGGDSCSLFCRSLHLQRNRLTGPIPPSMLQGYAMVYVSAAGVCVSQQRGTLLNAVSARVTATQGPTPALQQFVRLYSRPVDRGWRRSPAKPAVRPHAHGAVDCAMRVCE